jgi:hypothetical protein
MQQFRRFFRKLLTNKAKEELSSRTQALPPKALTKPDVALTRHPVLVLNPSQVQEFAIRQITSRIKGLLLGQK